MSARERVDQEKVEVLLLHQVPGLLGGDRRGYRGHAMRAVRVARVGSAAAVRYCARGAHDSGAAYPVVSPVVPCGCRRQREASPVGPGHRGR